MFHICCCLSCISMRMCWQCFNGDQLTAPERRWRPYHRAGLPVPDVPSCRRNNTPGRPSFNKSHAVSFLCLTDCWSNDPTPPKATVMTEVKSHHTHPHIPLHAEALKETGFTFLANCLFVSLVLMQMIVSRSTQTSCLRNCHVLSDRSKSVGSDFYSKCSNRYFLGSVCVCVRERTSKRENEYSWNHPVIWSAAECDEFVLWPQCILQLHSISFGRVVFKKSCEQSGGKKTDSWIELIR